MANGPAVTSQRNSFYTGLLVAAAWGYALSGMLVQLAVNEAGTSTAQLALVRALMQGSCVLAGLRHEGLPVLPPRDTNSKWILLRGLIGATAFILAYHSISCLPLGDATLLFSLYPIVATFVARAALKEKVPPATLWALLVTVAGVVLLCRPSFLFGPAHHLAASAASHVEGDPLRSRSVGITCALAAGFLIGLLFPIYRIAAAVNTLHFMLAHSAANVVLALLAAALPGQGMSLPSGRVVAFTLGQGLLSTAAQFCMTLGSKRLPSARASVVTTSEILWAYCLQVAVFRATPDPLAAVGAALVVLALLLSIAGKSAAAAAAAAAAAVAAAGQAGAGAGSAGEAGTGAGAGAAHGAAGGGQAGGGVELSALTCVAVALTNCGAGGTDQAAL
jgi:drug/metabolite transporter (DMT)-like permease